MISKELIIINGKKCIVNNMENKDVKKGLVVVDLSEQCDYPDLEVLPVKIIEYENYQEKHEIYKYNIVLGEIKDYV